MMTTFWEFSGVPPLNLPALQGHRQCDVAIIGGGFSGLSTALHVAKDGAQPLLLEAEQIGYGASGRNGGFVSGKFRAALKDVARQHGVEVAKRLYELGHEAVEAVE